STSSSPFSRFSTSSRADLVNVTTAISSGRTPRFSSSPMARRARDVLPQPGGPMITLGENVIYRAWMSGTDEHRFQNWGVRAYHLMGVSGWLRNHGVFVGTAGERVKAGPALDRLLHHPLEEMDA